ncbi:MAG TPA: glycosyltransferase [Bacteroidia bacterium]|nr:glycosyltransferase [Bacteroidia bacterium]
MITYHRHTRKPNEVFTILLPSWNNKAYLVKCIESIRKNSAFSHQVVVHVNDGSDGTLQWLENEKIDYTHSKENVGICYALNAARTLAHTDYIVYMNDDMYALPGWDKQLMEEIEKAGHTLFFFSSTMIEPYESGNPAVIAPNDYGRDLDTFKEEQLLKDFAGFSKGDWMGATWPPNVVHISTWDLVGGYSTEFSPGMYSDPDFTMKLWHAGVRLFKGVAASRVYHFGSKSTLRIKKNNGYRQFIKKWGITPGLLNDVYIKRGQPFTGPAPEPEETGNIKIQKLKARIKSI